MPKSKIPLNKAPLIRQVAWAVDYRGVRGDVPSLVFVGVEFDVLRGVIDPLFSKHKGLFRSLYLYEEQTFYPRNGKTPYRQVVEFHGLNTNRIEIYTLGIIISNLLKKSFNCQTNNLTNKNKIYNI